MPPLTPERWRTVSPLLDRALDLETEARNAWLVALGERDAELAADLRTLLAGHDTLRASRFLEQSVAPPTDAPRAGQRLGAYRLVSIIGEGGMGSVWLAERCDGRFEGRAAIKLLNVALMGPAGQERFRREGDLLARLSHPNIARLSDAGVSPAGQPYLVLEHVEGLPIDRYCDEHTLDVDARLRLFLHVLDAVAHAHANLVVHRDIKPPNVLVTAGGRVKLLDFGIGKLLERDDGRGEPSGMASALTRESGTALTPAYAAPEQLTGAPVTTATDVYALGVLLYVLLTGKHPAGNDLQSPAEIVRAIVDAEAPRLPAAVVSSRESPEVHARDAALRGTTPRALKRRLEGDLDVIVGRALKKPVTERYPSVTALADDLRRSLHHEPIGARADSVWYRAASFVRRHRVGVSSTAAMVALVATLTAFYTGRLATERDRAQLEAEKAFRMSALLTGLLTSADPYATREMRGEPTVRAVLDAGAVRLQHELAGQPELQAEMMDVIGRVYQRLGLYDKAQPLLERAVSLGRSTGSADHPQLAQSLNDLGVLLGQKGDLTPAAATLEEALAMRRRRFGEAHEDVAVTLVELARVYLDGGQRDRAEPLLRSALAIRLEVLDPGDRNIATSMSDLGLLLWERGDVAGAEPLLRQALAITRQALAGDHPDVATAMNNVALIEQDLGHHRLADELVRQAIAISRVALGHSHASVATSLNSLASSLREQGRLGEADAALSEAAAIARGIHGDEHPLIAMLMVSQARVALARGDAVTAEPLLRHALAIRQRTLPAGDTRVAIAQSLLGGALTRLGRHEDAEPLLLDAYRVLKDGRGRLGVEGRATATRLVALYEASGRAQQAAPYRVRAPAP